MRYSRGTRRKQSVFSSGRRRSGRSRRSSGGSKLFLGGLALVVLFGVGKLLASLFSGGFAENASAEIQILRGRVEFQLEESEDWTRAYSDQKFLPGDSIKTIGNARVSLEFLGGNVFFLGPETEIQIQTLEEYSSGQKKAHIFLRKGQIWAHIPDEKLLEEGKSRFVIETQKQEVEIKGSIFDITVTPNEDIIRLVRGAVSTAVLLDPESGETQDLSVGVGQKFVLNSQSIESLKQNQNVLEITDNEFLESEWHLENLEQFAPEEAAQIRRKIEISAPKIEKTPEDSLEASDDIDPPKILSPADKTTIPASQDMIKIEGSASLKTFQISVNGYTLTKFQPGDKKWTYFASKKFGTLVAGENKYSIVAISRDGKKSKPAEITLFYEGESAVSSAPDVQAAQSTDASFPAPVITNPKIIDPSQPYETSSEVVTISGTVPLGTIRVTVNDFVLKKFSAGNTNFSYIANANYGNLKKGENTFVINAYSSDGKVSTTTIKVFYTPLNL